MSTNNFEPMAAGKVDPKKVSQLNYPLYGSPKMDGVRAVVRGGVLMSRNMLPIPNKFCQRVLGSKDYEGLDGELVVGDPNAKDVMHKTISGVMSIEGEPNVSFYVFDDCRFQLTPFFERYRALKTRVKGLHVRRVKLVEQRLINDEDILIDYEEKMLDLGYEGVMLRAVTGTYKFGRSTVKESFLLKLKRFEDSEAEIVGFVELQHNSNQLESDNFGRAKRSSSKAGKVAGGVLGAFKVRDVKTKVEFELGTGISAADRSKFWEQRDELLGKIVKYKFFPIGVKDKPRFPTFIGFRPKGA